MENIKLNSYITFWFNVLNVFLIFAIFCVLNLNLNFFTLSEIFLLQLFRRRLLASGQDRRQTLHTCYFWQAASAGVQYDRAGALKVCLRSVEIFDWKDWQNKKSAVRATGHDHVAGDITWAERYRFRRAVWNRC